MNKLEIEVEFFSKDRGGRDFLPSFSGSKYRPHLLVEGRPKDEYLGVIFLPQEGKPIFNSAIKATIELVFEKIDYASLKPGVTFSVMEGGKKVGAGKVL